jgi:hypothetical protein
MKKTAIATALAFLGLCFASCSNEKIIKRVCVYYSPEQGEDVKVFVQMPKYASEKLTEGDVIEIRADSVYTLKEGGFFDPQKDLLVKVGNYQHPL